MSDSMTVHRLSDLLDSHFSGPSPTCIERNIRGNEWGVFKTTCSTTKGWNWRAHKVLPPAFWNLTRLEVKSGDSIITKAGPRHRVGVASFVDFVPPRIIPSGKMICLRPNPERVLPAYLALALSDSRTQRYLDQRTTGMAESQVNFENNALLGAPVWLPERDEQEHIFEALTGPTAAVTSLERLIEKKQAIKQGMVQQLLTGKTRLPGFTGEWVPGCLGDVLKVRHGRNQREVESPSGEFPILGTGGVIGRTDTPLYSQPSVLIGRKGTIDRPQFRDTPFWTVDTLFYTEISESSDPRFLYYFATTVDWRSMNEGSGVPSLNSSQIESVKLHIPLLDEQRAIGATLKALELEVEALEEKLAKLRAIKSGIMQELLTGHTRLTPVGV